MKVHLTSRLSAVAISFSLALICATTGSGQIFVSDPSSYVIGKYDATTGATIANPFESNPNTITPTALAFDSLNGDLYVIENGNGTIAAYNGSGNGGAGAIISQSFISGVSGQSLLYNSTNNLLYVGNSQNNMVQTYNATTGMQVQSSLINLGAGNTPVAMAFGGPGNADLYVTHGGTVTEYNTLTGAVIPTFTTITVPQPNSFGLAVAGNDLFLASFTNFNSGKIAEYDATTGALINSSLISLNTVNQIAISNNHLYAVDPAGQVIGEYNFDGSVVNGSLVSLPSNVYFGITVVPEPSTWALLLGGLAVLIAFQRKRPARI